MGMKFFARIIALIFIAVISVTVLVGCAYAGYHGDYSDAYTLIYSQVPDILGARARGPLLVDPQIFLLEGDDHGRALYIYLEETDGFLSLGIVQKESDGKVYYYPEESTLSFRLPYRIYDIDNKSIPKDDMILLLNELCPDDIMEDFKRANDWNAPIDESKLESAEIGAPIIPARWETRTDKVNLPDYKWEDLIFEYAEKNGHKLGDENNTDKYFSHEQWMATDNYGRRLYYVEAYYYIYPPAEESTQILYERHYLEMIAIINPDGGFDSEIFMTELADKVNYQEQIRELKLANGWNQPL